MSYLILFPVILPILAGLLLLLLPSKTIGTRKNLVALVITFLAIALLTSALVICGISGDRLVLFSIVEDITIYFSVDEISRIFASITTYALFIFGIFSLGYMETEHGKKIEQNEETITREKRYHAFYLMVYGVLMGLDFAGNLVTLYLFYELMTLTSAPLVFHTQTRESIMAGLKYMFYSFAGAYMALFGIYFLNKYVTTLNFIPGGTLSSSTVSLYGEDNLLLVVVLFMIIGFGVKAGMFPFHAWLTTAHPVAPAPASAALSAIIVKCGVLAVIRVVYYVVGADVIVGTWVQTVWLILTMITVLMGSALAFKEKILKKRFAYSTVSNLSYIMMGLAFLNPIAVKGALLHVIFHSIIKGTLFMFAGYIIASTGRTRVNELKGLGKRNPILFKCYVVAAFGLVGIPPTCGLVSKWFLAIGALNSKIPVFSWLGPVVLLVSALLTAGYMFPIITLAYLEDDSEEKSSQRLFDLIKKEKDSEKYKTNYMMMIPIVIVTVFIVFLGIAPTFLLRIIDNVVSGLM